jgi:hypothetical protein
MIHVFDAGNIGGVIRQCPLKRLQFPFSGRCMEHKRNIKIIQVHIQGGAAGNAIFHGAIFVEAK